MSYRVASWTKSLNFCFMSINVGYIVDTWKKNNIHGYNIVCNLFNNLDRHFSKKKEA